MNDWREEYAGLSLCGGSIRLISGDEDRIEITYREGMAMDIGRAVSNHCYYITALSSNDASGWSKPLAEIAVHDKQDVLKTIQETILKFRLL